MRLKGSVRQNNLLSFFFLLNLNFVISTRIAKLAPVLTRQNSIRVQGIFFGALMKLICIIHFYVNNLQSWKWLKLAQICDVINVFQNCRNTSCILSRTILHRRSGYVPHCWCYIRMVAIPHSGIRHTRQRDVKYVHISFVFLAVIRSFLCDE